MSTVAGSQSARHGKCRLQIVINGKAYVLLPGKAAVPRHRLWRLSGPGSQYAVCYGKGVVSCSCPDAWKVGHQCKHIGALKALGLVPRSCRVPLPLPENQPQPAWPASPPPAPR
jgi:hypothetical protein